jgi:hypothetical protein
MIANRTQHFNWKKIEIELVSLRLPTRRREVKKKMNWKRKLIWTLLTITLIIPFVSTTIKVNIIPRAHAFPDNTISITPSNITNLSLDVDDTFAVNITVDYVEFLWQWQFELSFNPDVIHGVWYDEELEYPVEPDPDGFLESEDGSMIVAGGSGWNNTLGRLWLTGASLLLKLNPVNGTGVLARATFKVVGKGESNITLGENTALFNLDGIIATPLNKGYFRNVLTSEIPTAVFTYSPVGTPEPLQGYYTKFNGSDSTATGVKTIDKYKWYFWETINEKLLNFDQPKLRPDGDGTYTDWTNNFTQWNSAAFSTYVYANADAMYESSTLQDHTSEIYTVGKVRVTVFARNTVSASDERVQIMLVIGGTMYYGANYTLTSVLTEYTSDWEKNPVTDSAWTWSDIDSLEAGVRSLQEGASWTGEIRVFQLYIEALQTPVVDVDVDTIYQNVTRRGTWNVTLTVIDSEGVVGSTTQEVSIKAHDVAIADITTDAPTGAWPPGVEYVDIGNIVIVNVTVANRGDFAEQHSPPDSNFTVTAYYEVSCVTGFVYGIIGTANVTTPLAAGASTNLTFQWDTSGRNVTFPMEHTINATVTRVQYEYVVRDNTVDDPSGGHRVRFHDVAVTEVEVYPHRMLRQDGDGTFTDWTGTYEDWNDWPEHNGDADYVSATADAMNQSSTLEDHTVENWSIEKVRVTVFARVTSLPSEQLILMLVIGGEAYGQTYGESLTLSYAEYSYEWWTNPATDSDWTWQDIDLLEVGVISNAIGVWTGEIRVTQLYVEVFGAAGPVASGEVAMVAVTVENQGDFNETAIDVTAYYNGGSIGTQIIQLLTNRSYGSGTGASPFETANFTITLLFDWNTTGIPLDTYTISANTSLIPDDYEPNDNTFVNGDMDVATPRDPSTISIDASPLTVMVGEAITVSGSITPVRTGVTVTIWYRTSGVVAWSDLTSVVTDGSGQYSYDWTTTAGGTFELRATWPGDDLYLPATSSVITVEVNKLDSAISIEVSPTSVMIGDTATVNGSITPVRVGVTVTIWYRTSGVVAWSDLTSVVTDGSGQYSYDWTTTDVGTFELNASWPGDSAYLPASSGVITVVVTRLSSSISIAASPENVTYRSITSISGSLTPALEGATVTIRYRLGGGVWSDLTSVVTDGSGQYSYDWNATTAVGTYEFKASWPGDSAYLPAESSAITVVVKKIITSISFTITPTTVKMGNNLNFSGVITPALQGVRMTIWYRTTEATTWTDLTGFHPMTDANGRFSYDQWDPNVATVYEFKASWPGDAFHEGADSNIVTVTVELEPAVDWTLPAVAIVGVIIAAVVLVYFLKFRKRSKE